MVLLSKYMVIDIIFKDSKEYDMALGLQFKYNAPGTMFKYSITTFLKYYWNVLGIFLYLFVKIIEKTLIEGLGRCI